jgi:hypothetical protein
LSGIATLQEIDNSWSLTDVLKANLLLDVKDEMELIALESKK